MQFHFKAYKGQARISGSFFSYDFHRRCSTLNSLLSRSIMFVVFNEIHSSSGKLNFFSAFSLVFFMETLLRENTFFSTVFKFYAIPKIKVGSMFKEYCFIMSFLIPHWAQLGSDQANSWRFQHFNSKNIGFRLL